MISLIEEGLYKLIETKSLTKILTLNKDKIYAIINVATIGEILVTTHKKHHTDHILAIGKYRLYEVQDEPKLTDLIHLELLVGNGIWQGYLLPTGLPTDTKIKARIIPVTEIISKSMSITKL